MSKVLKVYDDGSELTVGGLAVAGVIVVVTGTVAFVSTIAWESWRDRRFYKKHNKMFDDSSSK